MSNRPNIKQVLSWIDQFALRPKHEQKLILNKMVKAHIIIRYELGTSQNGHTFSHYNRARVIENHERPNNFKGVIWQPGAASASGRATGEKHRVLYTSRHINTAFAEVDADKKLTVIAHFAPRKDRPHVVSPIGEITRVIRSGISELIGEKANVVTNELRESGIEGIHVIAILDSFLHDCMINQDDNYEISGAISDAVFSKYSNIDCIAYPSVKHLGATNIAIRTDRFWEKWGIIGARIAKVRHLAQGTYDFDDGPIVEEIREDGTFVWSKDVKSKDYMTFISDPWVPEEFR